MKNKIIHLCVVAAIGLALTACAGHHGSGDRPTTDSSAAAMDSTTTPANSHESNHEHNSSHEGNGTHEHHGEPNGDHHSDTTEHKPTVQTQAGAPTVDTAAVLKSQNSTMTNGHTKHHVKPGGLTGQ